MNIKSKVIKFVPSVLHKAPHFAKSMLNNLGDLTPVAGTTFGIIRTAKKVYNCTSPMEAIKTGVKSVVINCTPPVVKYPVLCSAMLICAISTVYTGNPNLACGTIKCAEIIIEEASGG